jgi:hypothetical protein
MRQQVWRDLLNRGASAAGAAIKQIAPRHQRSVVALFFKDHMAYEI